MNEPNYYTVFLIAISLMLITARLLGELFVKLKQPAIIGEIIGGIILGPSLLGNLFPDVYKYIFPEDVHFRTAFDGLTYLAVIMMLIISGLEINLNLVLRQKKSAFFTSTIGMAMPFIAGFFISYWFHGIFFSDPAEDKMIFALFLGTAISISSLPVIARILMDMNLIRTNLGSTVIAAAIINDLLGWAFFSVILGMMGTSHGGGMPVLQQVTVIIVFLAVMLIGFRNIIEKILVYLQNNLTFPGAILTFIFTLGFLSAAFTEWIGIHAIFGAFIAGVAIGDTPVLKEKTRDQINQFVTNIFAPLFFISIGLKVDFVSHFDIVIVAVILGIALIGKVLGAMIGARFGGFKTSDAAVIGFGMSSSGTMGIILGLLALQAGIINEEIFVALVIMALVTSIISAPLMSYFLGHAEKAEKFPGNLDDKSLFITEFTQKSELLEFLCSAAASKSGADKSLILSEVLKREELIPTGIANGLAIPHAKIRIRKPVTIMAVNREPVDFEAPDGLPANVIVMLLTPEDKPELQLNYLSDIVKKFRTSGTVNELLRLDNKDKILSFLKSDGAGL